MVEDQDQYAVEKIDDLEDIWRSHIQERGLSLFLIRGQNELQEAAVIHQRYRNHANAKQKQHQLLDTVGLGGVSVRHYRYHQHLANPVCVQLVEKRLISSAKVEDGCWLPAY